MRGQNKFLAVVLASNLLMLGACSEQSEPDSSPAEVAPLMTRISLEDWEFELRDFPPNILVVDYWATWCAPCIERFPRMVEMAQQYADQGVTFVSFNLDEPEDIFATAQAEDFLMAMDANFNHYATAANVFDTMEYLGLQSIPAVSIYDRNGVEAQRLTGDDLENPEDLFDDADVEAAIVEILAEQPIL